MIRRIHPLLLAAVPVAFLYAHSVGDVSWQIVAVTLAIAVGGAGGMLGLAHAVFGRGPRAALAASVGVAIFFSYGRLFDVLWDLRLFSSSRAVHTVVSTAYAAVGFSCMRWLRRTPHAARGTAIKRAAPTKPAEPAR